MIGAHQLETQIVRNQDTKRWVRGEHSRTEECKKQVSKVEES